LHGQIQTSVFGEAAHSAPYGGGKKPQHSRQTPRRKFMQIGVPRCGERHAELVCQRRSQYAAMPRSGDMHHIGTKSLERAPQTSEVARKQQIERQIRIQLQHCTAVL
jgi:hypothetical protein